jgi:two-component system, NtrC family, nitrogen regulation sensor histidine kinase NtrY
MPARRSLERKLFGWLAALAVLPSMLVLAVSIAVGSRSLRWIGTLGPWDQVAESGRALIDQAVREGRDTALVRLAERHRQELSESLIQANRWNYLGTRLATSAPAVVAVVALLLVLGALFLSRRLARDLARPIGDLVDWAGRMGRAEPLPGEAEQERREPGEVQVLRAAMRAASTEVAEGRRRAVEAGRTRAWGEMARRVAHEMKNPLTPLRLAAHRLEKGAAGDAAVRDIARVIREETSRLDEMAKSFAALGRPATGPATAVDLDELLRGLISTDVPDGITTSLTVSEGGVEITGRYDALQRALRNLLRNAVEAVQQGQGTSVDVTVGIDGAGSVEIVIADDGIGIPDGLAEAIFEPDRTLKAGGTGLGLAIVQQVITAHGGTVWARNRAKGAEFVVRLPAEPRGETASNTRGIA